MNNLRCANKFLILACFLIFVGVAEAQNSTLVRSTFNSAGGSSASSSFKVQSSAGENVVGISTQNSKEVESGFLTGFRYLGAVSSTLDMSLFSGWNMVSVPFVMNDYRKAILYPSATTRAYSYNGNNGGYLMRDTLQLSTGYWIKLPVSASGRFTGFAFSRETVAVTDKWNMLAPSSFVILTSRIFPLDSTTIVSKFYGYFGGRIGYQIVDTLYPGHAYWIKVRKAGRLAIMPGLPLASPGGEQPSAGPATASVASLLSATNRLEIEDASGSIRSLYFSEGNSQIDGKMFEAPPKAPSPEIMDVRFSTGRILETAKPESQREIPVHIESGTYPLTLSMKIVEPGSHATLYVDDRQVAVTPGAVIQIANPKSLIKLVLDAASEKPLPMEFALRQNYPNPFNPSTTIRYDLPVRSMVTLKLYNVLGQVVKTLLEGIEDAGFKSIVWDASGNASGVYFYRLEARGIEGGRESIESKKMILMR